MISREKVHHRPTRFRITCVTNPINTWSAESSKFTLALLSYLARTKEHNQRLRREIRSPYFGIIYPNEMRRRAKNFVAVKRSRAA